ncbi:long-chain-fatty-acid-CoA ligase [Fomitiporia mediterranea MF3/22]|uniref:long-chain-fatty-acid-CoA ligase n=1 Tax=Fomitiporia mediterranea (strain MF3/22) TaxID=694068 RepID=UPI00044099E8|nr:long-chain-fatty-acid-CoA ligase [Fomitiporia mediterranea MF3/22]EJD00631.1 long-chain-fatty-acid-CoA ligase [Fomitiporia mediterranea MF3/22]
MSVGVATNNGSDSLPPPSSSINKNTHVHDDIDDFRPEDWKPKRSVAEVNRILTEPGRLHELEHVIIDDRVVRVYKNLPNVRTFWLDRSTEWANRDYIIFESERYTYAQTRERSCKLASLLYTKYGVRKGDRVAIIMRNYPEFMITFWAIHLLGGVATMINAWAPVGPLQHCITLTNPKIIIVDPERADRLASGTLLEDLKNKTSLNRVFVVRAHYKRPGGGKWRWKGMSSLEDAFASYTGPLDAYASAPECLPDENATIFFTSGTTGLPKGVLSCQRGFLTNIFNAFVAKMRAMLRKGEDLVEPGPDEPQKGTLISVPLFHVTGLTSAAVSIPFRFIHPMTSTALGGKIVFMHKWDKEEAARIIKRERLTNAGGVPSMIMDLIESSLDSDALENLSCGGAPSAETMPKEVKRRFKGVESGQGYGLSETNAIAVSIHADFLARPTSCGLASPVTDLVIVDPVTLKVLPPGQVGEIWIKGVHVMKGYWGDPEATRKAITRDGWFKSGDSACIDEEGFVYIKDRIKDIIIRGGENIHSVEVENALYADDHILDAAAVSVPDRRLGELVAAVVATKPHYKGQVSEEEVIDIARRLLPPHAVPVMVLVQDDLIERNANGKIMKDSVRKRVRREWARRLKLRGGRSRNKSGERTKAKL